VVAKNLGGREREREREERSGILHFGLEKQQREIITKYL